MKRKNIMKLLSLLFVLGLTLIPTHSKAADYTNLTVTEISDMATFDTITPQLYNQPIAPSEKQYYTFTLTEDSWLYYRFNLPGFASYVVDCNIYNNEYLTNKVGYMYFCGQTQMSNFYPKGTYYLVISSKDVENTTYSITMVSIPCSKVFEPTIQYSADKKSATVSYKNPFGTSFDTATYINKEVLLKDVGDYSIWYDGKKVEENPNKELNFTVTENGTYTFKIFTRTSAGGLGVAEFADSDDEHNSYSKVFQITGIEKTEETKEPETTVVAKAQTIKVKAAKTLKFKKKKKITYKLNAKVADNAKLSYKVVSTPKKAKHMIRVNKKGLVTFKKAAKKGTYKIKITAAKTANYRSAVKTVTLKIK